MISGIAVKSHAQKYFLAYFANGDDRFFTAKVSIAQTENMRRSGYPSEAEGLAQCDAEGVAPAQALAVAVDSDLVRLEVVNTRFDVLGTVDLSQESN